MSTQTKNQGLLLLGREVEKTMNCGERGYDLYLDNGEKINFSMSEFNAWMMGQIPHQSNNESLYKQELPGGLGEKNKIVWSGEEPCKLNPSIKY